MDDVDTSPVESTAEARVLEINGKSYLVFENVLLSLPDVLAILPMWMKSARSQVILRAHEQPVEISNVNLRKLLSALPVTQTHSTP